MAAAALAGPLTPIAATSTRRHQNQRTACASHPAKVWGHRTSEQRAPARLAQPRPALRTRQAAVKGPEMADLHTAGLADSTAGNHPYITRSGCLTRTANVTFVVSPAPGSCVRSGDPRLAACPPR